MTRQEVAVARSHVEAWKEVVSGSHDFVLILEDDAWFKPGARTAIDRGWRAALGRFADNERPQLLYLSYSDAGGTAVRHEVCADLFRPVRGLWFLSGYVLSREGAAALLRAMPVVGPVDLWMNYRFPEVKALALSRPAIAQRHDVTSDNAYSMMPFLARAGIVDGVSEAKPTGGAVCGPVLAWSGGRENECLAMALSMLGMRVRAFDGHEVPMDHRELSEVLKTFDALIDPPLAPAALTAAAADDRFLWLREADARAPDVVDSLLLPPRRSAVLRLNDQGGGTWRDICSLLQVSEPVAPFPSGVPREFRMFRDGRLPTDLNVEAPSRRESMPIDDSPWALPTSSRWRPSRKKDSIPNSSGCVVVEATMSEISPEFRVLTETFPGNLSSFAAGGLEHREDGVRVVIDVCKGEGRPYQSGAFVSARSFSYGRFQAQIQAVSGSGLVTGFFLHRGSPRQEIDIEFAGSDPRRMLTNVFFNPGDEGTEMDYGYRGSPCWIDLGFDATEGVHEYAIDWRPDRVTWLVDRAVVHERASWDPTPIPHLAMRVYGNVWAPRSEELAGRVDERALPASASFRNVVVAD
ncbi:family 16 glycosylhydrolase [Georgenia faecalis]|uniref:Beta-glucanase n=1 Tax=Georgenia faecalis TaxID=2483799 RepID=A0ABV9DAI1_9MICO|nr:family 16 glycosylhydrolase [Georgenia faecalis]